MDIEHYMVYLEDDGTMDTVLSVQSKNDDEDLIMGKKEYRFTDDEGFYRDEDGAITESGFFELAEQAIEMFAEEVEILNFNQE
jgi:hypothetical protein